MEHLATLDAAFFALEDEHTTLQIASLAIFAGPPLDPHDLTTLFRRKLHLVPRLRQMLRPVPFDLARPAWVDDTDFALENHLRHAQLPAPGGRRELEQLMGDLVAAPLDAKRPLWQVWLIDGLGGEWAGRWALVTKLHHSMLDGVGGMALLGRIYDRSQDARLPPPDRWIAAPQPSTVALLGSAMRVQAHEVVQAVRGAVRASVRPRSALHEVRVLASGFSEFRSGLARTAPSPLTGPLGSARAYATGSIALSDLETIRASLGGTLNDVVLALVTAAQRDLIFGRHQATQPHQVQCLVPVSLRSRGSVDPSGNKVSALIIDLPVDFDDPLTRYQALLARVHHAKQTHEAETGADMQTALDALPAAVVTPAIRAAARAPQHFLTTVATNVPGPGKTLYALGRPLVEHYPYVPIADRLRTGFAVTSYGDRLFYGVTADRDSIPDTRVVSAAIDREIAVLTQLARGQQETK